MEGRKIENIVSELLNVLYHNFIYYIPSLAIPKNVLDEVEGELTKHLLDDLTLVDVSEGLFDITPDDVLELQERINDKKHSLDKNCSYLVELKTELPEAEFNFLIHKYVHYLLFFEYISVLMVDNFNTYYKKKVSLATKGAFLLQQKHFSSHLNEIKGLFQSYFKNNNRNISIKSLIVDYLPDVISTFKLILDKDTTDEHQDVVTTKSDINIEVVNTSSRKKKEKPVLVEENVEKMILNKVFNIEEDLLNNK